MAESYRVNVGARRAVVACALASSFAASAAAQTEDIVPLYLRYAAPSECPDAGAFFAQVEARTALARRAEVSGAATELRVSVRRVPGGHAGILELHADGTQTSTREVSAAECVQVVTALALMTALAVDPNASTAPLPEPAQPAPSPPKPVATQLRAPSAASVPTPERFRFELGAAFGLLAGFSTDPSWLVRPFAELARERSDALGYSFRLSAGRAYASVRSGEGGVELTLWAARAEACPWHVPLGSRLRLAPCAELELGQLHALGRRVSPTRAVDRPWLAPGALVRLEFSLFGPLVLEVAGELFSPLVRDRFFVNTDSTVYRTKAVLLGATLGLGYAFSDSPFSAALAGSAFPRPFRAP